MQTVDYWYERIVAADIICGPVYSIPEAVANRHAVARGAVQDVAIPGAGSVPFLSSPMRFSAAPRPVIRAPSSCGWDTRSVLSELGLSDTELEQLGQAGVIGLGDTGK